MLLNELHQGGIRALLAWQPDLFDGLQLPEDVSAEDVVDRILYKYGDTPLFTPDPEVIRFYIGRWSKRRLPLWERYKAAIELEYDPIENYDRHEDSTRERDFTATHTGTVSTDNTGDVTSQRASDNSSSWENYDKDLNDLNTTSENNLTDTDAGSETFTSRIHGNIGVTTSQMMLSSELDLIPRLDLIDYIADDWHSEFNLYIY